MKILLSILCLFLLLNCRKHEPVLKSIDEDVIATIAFGSCSRQDKPQILWDDVIEDQVDMWIWLGDNIYGDSPDTNIVKQKYQLQKSNVDYQALRRNTAIYGIWDDHDFGINDGGKEFEAKAEMRDLMLQFLDVPRNNDVWSREGGYQSYTIAIATMKIKLILLDSRYFRDKPVKKGKTYEPNFEGTILGEEQWAWLENELDTVTEDLVLIGNGIQVIPEEHRFEKWANFPNERQRLLELVEQSTATKVILLSGDRHLTEVSKIDNGKTIYEITCSGMTHPYTGYSGEANKYRIGDVVVEKNYGLLKVINTNDQEKLIFEVRGDKRKVIQTVNLDY